MLDASDWNYIGDQLRAIRQDLLVQGLHDPVRSESGAAFAAGVYATNGRWAIEAGYTEQFTQCATQLREMSEASNVFKLENSMETEFLVCRLLHSTLMDLRSEQVEIA